MTDKGFGGHVRAEMTSLDIDDDCPSTVTLIVKDKEKSRRNKHQTSSVRTSTKNIRRKGDSIPVQKCREAAQSKKSKKNWSLQANINIQDNKYTYDDKVSRKEKEKKFDPQKKEGISVEKAVYDTTEHGGRGSLEEKLVSESEMKEKLTPDSEVRGPPGETLISEPEIRGPPEVEFEINEPTRILRKNEEFVKENVTPYMAGLSEEKSNLCTDKKAKEERNSKETGMKVQLPQRTMKTQEDQLLKLEMLNAGPGKEQFEKSDNEKEKDEEKSAEDEAEKCAAKMKFLWVEGKGSEGRLKQVNHDGVTCYYDNRLMEEREKDETVSKQRLDPQYPAEKESKDSGCEKFAMALQLDSEGFEDDVTVQQQNINIPIELTGYAETSLDKTVEDCRSSPLMISDMATSPKDARVVSGTIVQGDSQKEITENAWPTDFTECCMTDSKEPTEDSWREPFKSSEYGKLENLALNSPTTSNHELLMSIKATSPETTGYHFSLDHLKDLTHLKDLRHLKDLTRLKDWKHLKDVKYVINILLQEKRYSDSQKKEETLEAQKSEDTNDDSDGDDDVDEKYKDEETEKEISDNDEKESIEIDHGEVDLDPEALEYFHVEEMGSQEMDDGDCCSLKIYSLPRKQEVGEMERALELFDAKIVEYSLELQTGLEKLRSLHSMLRHPGLANCGTSSNRPPVNYAIRQCRPVPTYGDMNGRPPNPHGRLRKPRPDPVIECPDCLYVPEKQRERRLEGFRGHNFGRTCSNSGGQEGSLPEGSNGSSKNNGKSGRDQNGNHGDGQRSRDRNNNGGGEDGEGADRPGPRSPFDAVVPEYDPKRYKKKHVKMDPTNWTEFLGVLKMKTQDGPVWQIENNCISGCVARGLSSPDDLSDEMMTCCVCISINSFLKHYANCHAPYNACCMCVQIFSLICVHVTDCINNNRDQGSCNIRLCINILQHVEGSEFSNHLKTLWFHVRKKLARIIGTCEVDGPTQEPGPNPAPVAPRHSSVMFPSMGRPSLPSIPENGVAPPTFGSGSRVLSRKKSSLANVAEYAEPSVTSGDVENDKEKKEEEAGSRTPTGVSGEMVYTRGETVSSEVEETETGGDFSGSSHVKLDNKSDLGKRIASLPQGMRPGYMPQNYFPSFADSPLGIKGIGEVVYGDKDQLVVVADYFLILKASYRESGKLSVQYREEGVILKEYRNLLIIHGLRYSCQFQWIKHNPLGNGMSGKCHLASDFETNHNFCVKEIHISNYEKEEIELWSKLDHPNIVKIYGAIRYKETIYILQEFIEGGSLTEAINTQKILGRRLSQVTALAYLKQLLQVLIHLKSKHILHEDLKADNILLKQDKGSVSIKVTDFGLARRCPDRMREGTTPVGTQTQWSPEKSESLGYGYPAEVWAVIVEKSPPLEDIPQNIESQVKDLIERGFTVCQTTRPSAAELLKHHSFRLLEEANNGKTTSIYYSNLPSVGHHSLNTLEEDPNKDLKEIIENLEKEKSPYIPNPPRTINVYTVHNSQQNEMTPPQAGPGSACLDTQTMELIDQFEEQSGAVGPADVHVDPDVVQQYLSDHTLPIPPPPAQLNMTIYDPENYFSGEDKTDTNTPTEETIMKELLPNFEALGLGDNSINVEEDETEQEKEDIFKNFDLDKAIPEIIKSWSNSHLSTEANESPDKSKLEKSDSSIALYDEQYNTIEDEDELFKSGPGDDSAAAGGFKPLVRVALTKDNGSRGVLVVSPKPEKSPNQTAAPTTTAVKDFSLAPYLVPGGNVIRHSTPKPQSMRSPESGPASAKKLRFDTYTPEGSPMCTPNRHDPVKLAQYLQEGGGDLHVDPAYYKWSGNISQVGGPRTNPEAPAKSRKEEIDDLNQQRKKNLSGQSPQFMVTSPSSGTKSPLLLDVDKAQKGAPTPTTYAQTAPVVSPPRGQSHIEYKRTTSERPAPANSPSQQLHKTPSTTSTSQYDLQEQAYRELEEAAMSQHSDHSNFLNVSDGDDDPEDELHGEFEFDLENPAPSISHYLTQSPSDSILVTFTNRQLDVEVKVKFSSKSKTESWEKILDQEFGRHTELYASFDRVYLTHEDGTVLDLHSCLGDTNVTVIVEAATGEEIWWIENGVLMKS